ncbi:hypothetical protein AAFF_G00221110 [Aldrovandia affinis]|uniref:Uncharacterized protein n=1 Tax=Aldrovandia affinis TaxID=143900 RepID=A0AAD7W408_9TELE|nr:hypothetical protein AAFF_G00221110 [Aldrovandia affinis]
MLFLTVDTDSVGLTQPRSSLIRQSPILLGLLFQPPMANVQCRWNRKLLQPRPPGRGGGRALAKALGKCVGVEDGGRPLPPRNPFSQGPTLGAAPSPSHSCGCLPPRSVARHLASGRRRATAGGSG